MSNATEPRTILVVDPREPARARVRCALERKGFRVLEASNGDEAATVHLLHPQAIHAVATRRQLPDGSGAAIASWMRTQRPGLRVFFIAC